MDPEPEEEPGAGWTCRKLHHRAEAATAVAAGTSTATRPLIQPIPQLRSTRPVTTQTTFGPATLWATRTVGKWVASKLPDPLPSSPPSPSHQRFQPLNQSAEQEINPLQSCFKHPDFPIHLSLKDTRRHLRRENLPYMEEKQNRLFQDSEGHPAPRDFFFLSCSCCGKKKKR